METTLLLAAGWSDMQTVWLVDGYPSRFGNPSPPSYILAEMDKYNTITIIVCNYNTTSNKKHFMKNVKECRDVIVKKVLEQG